MNKTFTDAIFDVFSQIADHNKQIGFDEPVSIYLAGGAAVHFYTRARHSDDIDAIMEPIRPAIPAHLGAIWDNNGVKESVDFDANYHPNFRLLNEGYTERAHFIKKIGKNISLYVLHPIDLVITKLLRYSDADADDIEVLVRHEAFDVRLFEELARDAMDAKMVPAHYRNHIQWVIDAHLASNCH